MFRRKPKEPQPSVDWMIVGLGNPGPQYAATRHNVGFQVVDTLALHHRIRFERGRNKALVGQGRIHGAWVVLVKPLTYMNLSGQSVAPLARSLGVRPDRILVISDDLDLAVGRVRLKPKGSPGGHNGHKSIAASLQTTEYPRLKIGIGRPSDETIDHVLEPFTKDEQILIRIAIDRCVEGCEKLVDVGLERAQSFVNESSMPNE